MKIISQVQVNIKPSIQKTDYIVGCNLLANLHQLPEIKEKQFSSFLLLSDQTVFKLYGKKVINSLQKLNKPVITSVITEGEKLKNITCIPGIVKPFFEHGFDRKTCFVSLGGGVITDLGGFLSSILLRGIEAIHLPTTLLGQIDAAIGGKSGVDLWFSKKLMYKNMIGAINQPQSVISDIDTLLTLPNKEILNGLGEIVKYWIGWGKPSEYQISNIKYQIEKQTSLKKLVNTISLCQKIKTEIVEKDPFDILHIREKLNLGHTIGHAIEGASQGELSHGQCVALGLVAIAKISFFKGFLKENTYQLIISTINELGLPAKIPKDIQPLGRLNLITAIKMDKKGGSFVLVKDIGKLKTNVIVKKNIINQVLEEIII